MLNLFQTEWDSVMSETCELKKHLDTVRVEGPFPLCLLYAGKGRNNLGIKIKGYSVVA